jgi:hypothetical protein
MRRQGFSEWLGNAVRYRGRLFLRYVRFGLTNWTPKGLVPSYRAYYPETIIDLPEAEDLYRRWIRGNKVNNNADSSRFAALVLNTRQLGQEGIQGDFAELGVWRGNSAAILAHYAARDGRRLYLFDTFAGFDGRDLIGIDGAQSKIFADTSLEYAKGTIGHDDVTTYLSGFFPDTVTDEVRGRTYALAHIDCDLYAPTKAALEFFYPRMAKGGTIIMHDYENWEGPTRAIDEFCRATGEQIVRWPDRSGTVSVRVCRS